MLYTLATLLPENEPVVSTYLFTYVFTCSPLDAAVTVAMMHNCTSTCQAAPLAAACMLIWAKPHHHLSFTRRRLAIQLSQVSLPPPTTHQFIHTVDVNHIGELQAFDPCRERSPVTTCQHGVTRLHTGYKK